MKIVTNLPKIVTNFLKNKFKECCCGIFEQFSDLWLTPHHRGFRVILMIEFAGVDQVHSPKEDYPAPRGNGRPKFSSTGAESSSAPPMRLPNPDPLLDEMRAPVDPDSLSSTGSGGRIPGHFQTTVLHWINFCLRSNACVIWKASKRWRSWKVEGSRIYSCSLEILLLG